MVDNIKTARQACQEWKETFPEPPTVYEELSFIEGYQMAIQQMTNMILKEMIGDKK